MSRSATGAIVSQARRVAAQTGAGTKRPQDSRQTLLPDRPRNETLRNGKLRNETLRNGKLRNGKLRNGKLRNGKLRNGKLQDEKPRDENRSRPREPAPLMGNGARAPANRSSQSAPPGAWRVVDGRAGDHPSIHQLLLAVFHAPSREEFHAEQDDPTYEPVSRVLVKQGSRIVSHAQLIHRTMLFGPLRLPVDQLAWLGTLPEFRRQGAASRLLERADEKMRGGGAALGLLRTRVPHFFHRAGWAVCGRHCYSQAKPRDILAQFWADPALRRDALNIRLWRHFEMPALMRIYAQNTSGSFGPLERSEAYWRWLISRGAFDHIAIALAGPDRLDLNEASAPIVGYAVVRQDRVVELHTNPAYPTAGVQLLARACSDAIERHGNDIVLEARACDALHQFVQSADGLLHYHEADDQEVFMAKLLDPASFLDRLAPLLALRFREADLPRGCELGILAGEEKFLLSVSRRGATLVQGRLGRSYLACTRSEFTRLLLGHASPAEAAGGGRLTASTQLALELAGILFPRLPAWRPLWDDLPA